MKSIWHYLKLLGKPFGVFSNKTLYRVGLLIGFFSVLLIFAYCGLWFGSFVLITLLGGY